MLDETSLVATLDAVNEAFFRGTRITPRERGAVARWLAGRCGQPGSYADMPAPTEADFASAPRLFTGERMTSGGGMACKLGNEGCRALIVLGEPSRAVADALRQAEAGMAARLDAPAGPRAGHYCCASCTVAFWRHLLAGGLDHQDERLANGLQHLTRARQGNGRWRAFPFWYTVWTLTEMDPAQARGELQYAGAVLERAVKASAAADDPYPLRRQEIARRAVAVI